MLVFKDADNLLQHFSRGWLLWIAKRPLVCGLAKNGERIVHATLKSCSRITGHRG